MEIFEQAFEAARLGRLKVMDAMLAVIPEPRKELSKYSPKLISLQIKIYRQLQLQFLL